MKKKAKRKSFRSEITDPYQMITINLLYFSFFVGFFFLFFLISILIFPIFKQENKIIKKKFKIKTEHIESLINGIKDI